MSRGDYLLVDVAELRAELERVKAERDEARRLVRLSEHENATCTMLASKLVAVEKERDAARRSAQEWAAACHSFGVELTDPTLYEQQIAPLAQSLDAERAAHKKTRAELDRVTYERDSLRLERDGVEMVRKKDNGYLLAELERVKAEREVLKAEKEAGFARAEAAHVYSLGLSDELRAERAAHEKTKAELNEWRTDGLNAGRRACQTSHGLEVAQLEQKVEELAAELERLRDKAVHHDDLVAELGQAKRERDEARRGKVSTEAYNNLHVRFEAARARAAKLKSSLSDLLSACQTQCFLEGEDEEDFAVLDRARAALSSTAGTDPQVDVAGSWERLLNTPVEFRFNEDDLARIRADEREQCAKLAEEYRDSGRSGSATFIAAAIRSRR